MSTAAPLRGLTVVVTRPIEDATAIADQLLKNGANVVYLPLIEIQPIALKRCAVTALQKHRPYSLIIFTSKNAVRCGLSIVQKRFMDPRSVLATIGPGTKTALNEKGIQSCLTGTSPYDSEALLNTPELYAIKSKSVLIVKGEGGRTALREGIRDRGGLVQELDCYKRVIPTLNEKDLQQITQSDIIMFTSRESACNLLKLLPKNLLNTVLAFTPVVGHSRIANTISQLGFKKRPIIAANPGDAAMLNALIQYARNGDLE